MDKQVLQKNFWRNLVGLALETGEVELDCGDCLDCLDQYVDLLESGENPATLLPEIEQHLTMCPCCAGEMKALLIAIEFAEKM